MKNITTYGTIKVKDQFNITYAVCDIEYTINEDETFLFIFKPNYSVIELTNPSFFQGIPGLNLDLKEKEYIRKNMYPVFISERCPMPNRENLYEELEEAGLDYYNPLLWLIKTNYKYSGDNLFVEEKKHNNNITFDLNSKNNINLRIKSLLEYICGGYIININNTKINDSNRKTIYSILINLYENSYYFIKKRNNKVGRKNIDIDYLLFNEIYSKYKAKKISINDALKKLKISKSTFYRVIKNNNF